MSQLFILIYLLLQVITCKEPMSTTMEILDHDFRFSSIDYKSTTDKTTESEEELKTETELYETTESEIEFSTKSETNETTESEEELKTETELYETTESEIEFSTKSGISETTDSKEEFKTETELYETTESEIEFSTESGTSETTDSKEEFKTETVIYETAESEITFRTKRMIDNSSESETKFSSKVSPDYITKSEVEFDFSSKTSDDTDSTTKFSSDSTIDYSTEMYFSESTVSSTEKMAYDRIEKDTTLSYISSSDSSKSKLFKYLNTTEDIFTPLYDRTEEIITSTLKTTTEDICKEKKIKIILKADKVKHNSISLIWNVNKLYCIRNTSYRLIWQNEDSQNSISLTNSTEEYTLNNLNPCSSYNITLQLLSSNVTISQKSIKLTTKKKEESITVDIFKPNVGSNFIELEWNASKIFCTKYTYNLIWSNKEETKNVILTSEINHFNITYLEACSIYNITLQIINEINKTINEEFLVAETKTTDEKINIELKADSIENNFIKLNWDINKLYCIRNTSYRLIWQNEDSLNSVSLQNFTREYTLNNLDPCTSYDITLQLLSSDATISQKSIKSTTKKKEESITVDIFNSNTGSNFIEVEWTTSRIFCTNFTYNLIWRYKEEFKNITLSSNVDHFNITDLEPCTVYNISLHVINEINNIIAEQTIVAETNISIPGPVHKVITRILLETLYIQWTQPTIAGNCVSDYELLITKVGSDSFCNNPKSKKTGCIHQILLNNITNYFMTNIFTCSEYNISIRSFNSDNQSSEYYFTKEKTPFEDVSSIQNLVIYPGDENLTVSWDPPENSFCVDYYVVFYNTSKEITNETNIILTGLESCSVYNVSVIAVSKNNNLSPPVSDLAETTEIALKMVEQLQLTSLNMSIAAQWKPPKSGSACVVQYRVLCWNKQFFSFDTIINETKIIILNLIPCETYEVMVIPISKSKKDGMQKIESQNVQPNEMEPPLNINETHVGKFWMQTSWNLIGLDTNKCVPTEAFAKCEEKNPSGLNWTIPYSNATVKLSEETTTVIINVTNLSPYTQYDCSAAIINIKGISQFSEKITVTTDPDVPSAPIFLSLISQSENSFNITWKDPVYIPGLLESFHLHIKSVQFLYPIPNDCPPYEQTENMLTVRNNENSYLYVYAEPSTEYTIKIAASTQAGQGNFSSPENTITLPGISGPVRINKETICNSLKEEYDVQVFLTWNKPCRSNGIITLFKLTINYYKFEIETNAIQDTVGPNITSYNITELLPDTVYNVYISANTENVTQTGEQGKLTFKTPAGIPPIKDVPNIIAPDPFGTDDPTTKVKVILSKKYFDSTMGQLLYFSLIVSQKDYEDDLQWGYLESNKQWPNMSVWKNDGEFIEPYQATPIRWQPFQTSNTISYILGNDNCINKNNKQNKYCNGPLRLNTKYVVTVRTYTENGFRDVFTLQFETDRPINQGMIVGIICAILLMATVITIGLFVRNGNYQWNTISCIKNEELNNNEPSVPQPIPVRKFLAYAKKILDEDKLSTEFQLIQKMCTNLGLATTTADLPHNRIKNRYANIKPFDETRVKLLSSDDELSDYINASFIRGYSNTVEYIAAQGPKQETVNDFWEMIYENNVTQIIMLTNFEEKGKNKCYPYFPTRSNIMELESMSIRCTLEIDFTTYISRTFQIYKDERKKEIIHLHFTKWPDFGVPNSTNVMIQFCNLIRKQYFLNPGLIVIHCSAGVGRTGTLVTLDILMQTVLVNGKLDIFGTVLNLRKQRVLMVQTEDQYEYIYNCIRDFINNPQEDTEITTSTSPIYENLSELQTYKSDKNIKESISESIM